ncbi:MAG TPA: sugar ABC transporter permease [Acidimicrobiia bacterium]|nr:sugar ABC transporter permease [Acidimicrobiia bacterium]
MSVTELPPSETDEADGVAPSRRSLQSAVRSSEIDTRTLGMVALLIVIWIGFHFLSGGTFLSARNLWFLSVQFAPVAIMATGMVLVIVSRNIDLSVGSMLGFVGMAMAILQAEILPDFLGFGHPALWLIVLGAGLILGALVGLLQGAIVAYVGVPSFIVTLGGLLVWRGVAWSLASGRTVAPMDSTFQLLGGGSRGSLGEVASWVVGGLACLGILALLSYDRRQRKRYGFRLRPRWAVVTIAVVGSAAVLAAVWVMNSYYLPENLARQFAEEQGIPWPEGGLLIPVGISYPVLIAIGVMLVMTFIANQRRFGRYVYSIGGNPEAANLSGINTRWTIVKTFMVMGILVGVAGAVTIARLNAATSGLGTLAELYVIAAAVIGGTSLAGGLGTVAGAVLGALVMQSLQSGMVLMGVDAPLQDIVVGLVLVIAVAVDVYYRRRAER